MSLKSTSQNAQDASERICDCGCGRRFVPTRSWQKYYSDDCRRWANEKSLSSLTESLKLLKHHADEISRVIDGMFGNEDSGLAPGGRNRHGVKLKAVNSTEGGAK